MRVFERGKEMLRQPAAHVVGKATAHQHYAVGHPDLRGQRLYDQLGTKLHHTKLGRKP
jgi:hypothetical protein